MNTNETENICCLNRADVQTTLNGKQTDLYGLRNDKGHEVAITHYGGALVHQVHNQQEMLLLRSLQNTMLFILEMQMKKQFI